MVTTCSEGVDRMENANTIATRKAYEAFAAADLDGIRQFLDPNIVWHQGGHDALSGEYQGVDEVLGLFMKEFELTDGNVTASLVDVYATDTRTIAVEHFVARRNGKTLEQTFPIVFNGTNGVAQEAWALSYGDDDETAEFWS